MNGRRNPILSLAPVVLVALVFILAATSGPARATATSAEGARAFIESLSGEAVAVIADKTITEDKRLRELHRLFVKGFDTRAIGRFAAGQHWRRASKRQLEEYQRLFEIFVVKSSVKRLNDYASKRLEIRDVRKTKGPHGDVIVFSHFIRGEGSPVRFDWRVRASGEGHKIVDVMVEGISMVITQRAVFNSVIRASGGNFDGLIAALRQQTLVTLAADHYSNLSTR